MAVNLGDDADVIPNQNSGTLRGRRSLRPDCRCVLRRGGHPQEVEKYPGAKGDHHRIGRAALRKEQLAVIVEL